MKDTLKEIELKTDPIDTKEQKKVDKKPFPVKYVVIPLGVIGALLFVIAIMLLPLRGVIGKSKTLATHGRAVADSMKNQDIASTKTALVDTRAALDELAKEYKKVTPLKVVPFLGSYIKDGDHIVKAAYAGLNAADKAMEALEPNADLLGFTGGSSFVQGTADERMQTAVKTMSSLTPKINEMAVDVDTLKNEIDQIDPGRYPKKIGSREVRSKIESTQELISHAANLFVNAQPLLINLPKLLGEPDDIRYLILFQNNGELRATGGFITAYGQFRISKGKVILEKADDIYNLDNSLSKKFPAPREITTFHKNVYNLHLRDSNLSPDFKLSMNQFEKMYEYTLGSEAFDGIWAIDTHVLVEALKILGPVHIAGREFSAEIDERCDCPRAIYELEDYSTRPVGYVREARKDIIGVLLQTLLKKALGISPSKYWGPLFQMLIEQINEKHILAYFHDNEAQLAAEAFNMAGRIMTSSESATLLKYQEGQSWDYLHINNSNMAGAKANMFVSESVTKEVEINNDGTITTNLLIEYKNPYEGSDCGLESGGLCLNAPLRNWVRVYVPKGSELIESKGSQSPNDNKPVPMEMYENLEKDIIEGFLIVNPLGTARLEISYKSPYKSDDGKYKLLIQKQPGTDEDEYIIKLNGKTKAKEILLTDTEYVF